MDTVELSGSAKALARHRLSVHSKTAPRDLTLSSHVMMDELEELGIPCTLVLDASIGYIMSEIDYVIIGAEGVVESGGIINKVTKYAGAF